MRVMKPGARNHGPSYSFGHRVGYRRGFQDGCSLMLLGCLAMILAIVL